MFCLWKYYDIYILVNDFTGDCIVSRRVKEPFKKALVGLVVPTFLNPILRWSITPASFTIRERPWRLDSWREPLVQRRTSLSIEHIIIQTHWTESKNPSAFEYQLDVSTSLESFHQKQKHWGVFAFWRTCSIQSTIPKFSSRIMQLVNHWNCYTMPLYNSEQARHRDYGNGYGVPVVGTHQS